MSDSVRPVLDLVDDTWIAAAPAEVADAVHDPRRWVRWWPELVLTVLEDRQLAGIRWAVHPAPGSQWTGTSEIWLEPAARPRTVDGVVLHYYLRVDPVPPSRLGAGGRRGQRRLDAQRREHVVRAKRCFWALGDELTGR
jgi:hypothetical protein